jgi:hypothetical protein
MLEDHRSKHATPLNPEEIASLSHRRLLQSPQREFPHSVGCVSEDLVAFSAL